MHAHQPGHTVCAPRPDSLGLLKLRRVRAVSRTADFAPQLAQAMPAYVCLTYQVGPTDLFAASLAAVCVCVRLTVAERLSRRRGQVSPHGFLS
jgi:hypothetical protein